MHSRLGGCQMPKPLRFLPFGLPRTSQVRGAEKGGNNNQVFFFWGGEQKRKPLKSGQPPPLSPFFPPLAFPWQSPAAQAALWRSLLRSACLSRAFSRSESRLDSARGSTRRATRIDADRRGSTRRATRGWGSMKSEGSSFSGGRSKNQVGGGGRDPVFWGGELEKTQVSGGLGGIGGRGAQF